MAKKKPVIIDIGPIDSSEDKKYRPLLVEHARLVAEWSRVGLEAASDYPQKVCQEHADLYRKTVKLAEQCRVVYEKIVAMNLWPCPLHYLVPVKLDLL